MHDIDQLISQGDLQHAMEALMATENRDHTVWKRIGTIHLHQGQLDQAAAAYRQALSIEPDYLDAHYNLGIVAMARGDLAGAIDHYRHAMSIDPDDFMVINNLAVALVEAGEFSQARVLLEPLAARFPQHRGQISLNLARICSELADHEAALAWGRGAVELAEPGSELAGEANYSLALELLLTGQWAEGIALHERRLELPRFAPPPISQPCWNGSPLAGATILLYTDQGFGDAIQFARYIPWLRHIMGGVVVVLCREPLRRLFEQVEDVARVVVEGVDPIPRFDTWLPMLSLAARHGSHPESMRLEGGYLDTGREEPGLAIAQDGLRVGLVWAGSRGHRRDSIRSIDSDTLLDSLPQKSDIHYYSLQPDPAIRTSIGREWITDLGGHLDDFLTTGQYLKRLDLLISVDTSVAHLAGALGLPVWLLLSHVPDWRWGLAGEDSPWYTRMRLFRQPEPGQWQPLLKQIAANLEQLSSRNDSRNG